MSMAYFEHWIQQGLAEKVLGACVIEDCIMMYTRDWAKQGCKSVL